MRSSLGAPRGPIGAWESKSFGPASRLDGNVTLAFAALIAVAAILPHLRLPEQVRKTFAVSIGGSTDFNLALDENGGAIESITGTTDPSTHFYGTGFNGRRLIDGQLEPTWTGDPVDDPSEPAHTAVLPGLPLEIVLSFYRHQSALVDAVVISAGKNLRARPRTSKSGYPARAPEMVSSRSAPERSHQPPATIRSNSPLPRYDI